MQREPMKWCFIDSCATIMVYKDRSDCKYERYWLNVIIFDVVMFIHEITRKDFDYFQKVIIENGEKFGKLYTE